MRYTLILFLLMFYACSNTDQVQVFEEDTTFKIEKQEYLEYANDIKNILLDDGLLINGEADGFYGAFKYLQKHKGTTYRKVSYKTRSALVNTRAMYSELDLNWNAMYLNESNSPLQSKLKKALTYLNEQESKGIEEISIAFLGHFTKDDFASVYLQSVLLIQLNQVMHDYYWDEEKKKVLKVEEDDALSWDQLSLNNHGYEAKEVLTIEPISQDSLYYKSKLYNWSEFEDTLNRYNDSLLLRVYFDDKRMTLEAYVKARKELEKRCKNSEAYLYMRSIRELSKSRSLTEEELYQLRKKYEIAILEI